MYRQSCAVVDINKIQNSQIFDATTNNTLINLDYIDPLQGKILGSARENIDFVSNSDPANYNVNRANGTVVWGSEHVGQLWFDTSNVRFVNYHQNDVTYNSKYWGTVFSGSDVAIYSWIESSQTPINYTGPGKPYKLDDYVISATLDSSNDVVPVYFYWVRHTNIIFTKIGLIVQTKQPETELRVFLKNPVGDNFFFKLQGTEA